MVGQSFSLTRQTGFPYIPAFSPQVVVTTNREPQARESPNRKLQRYPDLRFVA